MWALASTNLKDALVQIQPQLQTAGGHLLSAVGGGVTSFLLFLVSLVVAGVFMARADTAGGAVQSLATRIVGEQGREWALLCAATVRSVPQGSDRRRGDPDASDRHWPVRDGDPGAGLWSVLILLVGGSRSFQPFSSWRRSSCTCSVSPRRPPAVIFTVWSILPGSATPCSSRC